MNILLVTEDIPYPSMGGLAKHVLALAEALVNAGHQVDILGGAQYPITVAGDEGNFGGKFYGELSGHLAGWKERSLGFYNPLKRSWIAKRMARQIISRASGYDVIHYHGHFPNIGFYMPESINFVQTRHDQGSECLTHTRFKNGDICRSTNSFDCAACAKQMPGPIDKLISAYAVDLYRRQVMEAFKKHKTIFVSQFLKNNFSRIAGVEEWGGVIHNFVNMENINNVLSTHSLVDNKNELVNVFISGMLYPPKGVLAFLEKLMPIWPNNIKVTIAGVGVEENVIKNKFSNKNLVLLGWCDSGVALSYAARSDIIVVPSLCEESCATVIIEGLMLGKVVFALNRGGSPELRCYQSYEGQYYLFENLDELVDNLIHFRKQANASVPFLNSAGVDLAVPKIIDIYSSN